MNRRRMRCGRKSHQRMVKSKKKQVGMYTYHWCEHHIVWTVHKPAVCLLGKQHRKEQKKKPQKANSATVAAAATSTVNPHFTALMASLANLDK